MSQNLQNFVKFQKFQLENLVDFEKCCKTHIFLQKSVPIQPKTSNILPKFCQKLATTLRVRRACKEDRHEPLAHVRNRGGVGGDATKFLSHVKQAAVQVYVNVNIRIPAVDLEQPERYL